MSKVNLVWDIVVKGPKGGTIKIGKITPSREPRPLPRRRSDVKKTVNKKEA